MSGYKVENDCEEIYYNNEGYDITNSSVCNYWELYSKYQRKRFNLVLRQIKETWRDVYKTISFCREYSTVEYSNELMSKIYNMFIIIHKNNTEYYMEEKIRLRRQNGYFKKKINKIRNKKSKI